MAAERDTTSHPPAPQRRPQFTGRVLCIINAPAQPSGKDPLATPSSSLAALKRGKGWFVVRERWGVQL